MGISYNKNTGLAVDMDLALFVADTDVSVRMRSCSNLCKVLRPAFEMEHRVA